MTTVTIHSRTSAGRARTRAHVGSRCHASSRELLPIYDSMESRGNTRVLQLSADPTDSAFFNNGCDDILVDFDRSNTVGDFKRELYAGGSAKVPEDEFALLGYDARGLRMLRLCTRFLLTLLTLFPPLQPHSWTLTTPSSTAFRSPRNPLPKCASAMRLNLTSKQTFTG